MGGPWSAGGPSTASAVTVDGNRLRGALVAPIAGICVGHIVVNAWLGWNTSIFDLDDETSFGNWYSTAQLLVAALMAMVAARAGLRRARWAWRVVAALALLCSIDEVIGVHERVSVHLEKLLHLKPPFSFGLPVIAAAVAPLLVVALVVAYRRVPRPANLYLTIGGILYLLAAGGFEEIESWASDRSWAGVRGNWSAGFRTIIGFEETFEMVAAALVVWAAFLAIPSVLVLRKRDERPALVPVTDHGRTPSPTHRGGGAPAAVSSNLSRLAQDPLRGEPLAFDE